MKILHSMALTACLVGSSALVAGDYEFESPIQLKAGGEAISVESPGYAAPCLADIDGDGLRDLLVGQFNGGKISFYKGLPADKSGEFRFAAHQWLQAGGQDAEIPGVW